MKIAYVTLHVESKIINGGVGNKIKSHISLWQNMGHSVELFSLTPEPILSIPDVKQFFFRPSSNLPGLKFITREIARSRSLARLISAVRDYGPDIIYLRYGLFTFPLQDLFKIAPVAMEVNTNDIEEYRTRGLFFYWLNRLSRGIMFSQSSGLVPVSQELADLNMRYEKESCVVSNGVDLESIVPLPAPANQTPVLTAIGTPGMIWHGMDKLFILARQFPDLIINIIGYAPEHFTGTIPPNLKIHGYLGKENVRKILSETDVVFGTLAMHRKNMRENPALKVREALAFGIPVIIAHPDTDLADLETDCLLFLPNTEDNIMTHGKTIHEFAYRVMGKRIERDLIAPRIDQRKKEQARVAFFEKIVAVERNK